MSGEVRIAALRAVLFGLAVGSLFALYAVPMPQTLAVLLAACWGVLVRFGQDFAAAYAHEVRSESRISA